MQKKTRVHTFVDNLKTQAAENPLATIVIGAVAVSAAAKLMHVANESRNSRTWAKEVDRRRMKSL